ncbi:MAG TPA: FixH family protein [Candidatus Desulfobacillus sp.]|nr:FixH family protein [Candidatus Desulfobacillus sp.]
MKGPAPEERPWYRHRWPWLLMAGPAVVVVAGIATAWIAIATDDGLVSDDYYKEGLAVNQVLARNDAAAAMRLEARLRVSPGWVELALSSGAGAPLPQRVRVTLAHPTRGGADQALLLEGHAGVYGGRMAPAAAGRWRVVVEDEEGAWRLAGSAQLPDRPEFLLTAAGGK